MLKIHPAPREGIFAMTAVCTEATPFAPGLFVFGV